MSHSVHREHFPGEIGNRLLAALPADEYDRVRLHLTPVALTQGQILHQPQTPLKHVYFPETAVLSHVFSSEDGMLLEVGTVGRNGLGGVSVALGALNTPNQLEVLIGGSARRMCATSFEDELKRSDLLAAMSLRYAQATIIHSGQIQVCMRLHSPAERLAGWLLLLYDLNPPRALPLTQAAIGQMLGLRRTGVTEIANQLRARMLIDYSRGQIQVRDREALAGFSCNCVKIVSDEYERVFAA